MASKYCGQCGRATMHKKHKMVTDGVALLAILLTCGLALAVIIPLGVLDLFQPPVCQTCGRRNR